MKNRWIWVGALIAVVLIAITILKLSGGSKDVLNADGIRDDVATAIASTFPESERKRASAVQLARVFQFAIDEPEKALEIHKLFETSMACYYAIRGDVEENEENAMSAKVEVMVVNSYDRSRAYIRYNGKLSGQVFESIQPDLSACDFNADSLRN